MSSKQTNKNLLVETLLSYLYNEFINSKNERSFSAVNLLCPANYQKPNISAVSLYVLFPDLYMKLNKELKETSHDYQITSKLSRKIGSTELLTFERLPLFYRFIDDTEIKLSFINFHELKEKRDEFAFIDKFFNLLDIYDSIKTLKYDIFAILCDSFVFVNDIFEGILFSNGCPWKLNNESIGINKLLEKLNREVFLQITPYVAKYVPVDNKDLIAAISNRVNYNGFIVNNNIIINMEWKCIPLLRLEKVSDIYGKVDVGCLLFSAFTYYFHLSREYKVPNKNIVLEPIWFDELDDSHKGAHSMLSELKRLFTITAICSGIKEKILSSHW